MEGEGGVEGRSGVEEGDGVEEDGEGEGEEIKG